MRKLIMATVSVLALGIAGSGIGHAAEPYNSSTTTPASPSTAPGSAMQTPGRTTAAVDLSADQIKAAQQQLKAAGLYKGAIDGKMGTDTQQAIEQFQQKHGLPATGTLDEETMAALQGNNTLQGNNRSQAGSSANPGRSSANPGRLPSSTGR